MEKISSNAASVLPEVSYRTVDVAPPVSVDTSDEPQKAASQPSITSVITVDAGSTGTAPDQNEFLGPGEALGDHRILKVLGAGGMGAVYLAFDSRLERNVALKVLHQAHGKDSSAHHRLRREARVLAALKHENVVQVYEVGRVGERAYVAMEYIPGTTLRSWLAETRRSLKEIIPVFVAAARGLGAAHEMGVVHRDFKLDNVLISDDGRVCVVDFGVAYVGRPESEESGQGQAPPLSEAIASTIRLTRRGALVGTIPYMATEQLTNGEVGPWSDQFAFFANLYEAIYGELPWQLDATTHELHHVPQRRDGEGVPRAVRKAIARGMATDRHQRFRSMEEVVRALTPVLRRSRAGWMGGAAVLGVSAASWMLLPETCSAPEPLWDSPLRSKVESRLRESDPAGHARHFERLDSALASYSNRWRRAHHALCMQSASDTITFDRKQHCLLERKRTFEAQVRVLTDAPGLSAANVLEAALQLPELVTCASDDALTTSWKESPPTPAHLEEDVTRLHASLDEVRALERLGQWALALDVARKLLVDAESVGFAPFTADARLAVAELLRHLGQPVAAHREFERLFFDSQVSRQRAMSFEAALHLVEIEGEDLRQFKNADRWAHFARSELIAGEGDGYSWGRLLASEAAAFAAKERFAQATTRYEAAVERLELTLGAEHFEVLEIQTKLAGSLMFSNQVDRALEISHHVLSVQESLLGADHPKLYDTLRMVANAHFLKGDYAGAETLYRRQIRLGAETRGASHPDAVRLWSNLAAALMGLERNVEGEAALRQAIAIAPEVPTGEVLNTVATARLNLAVMLRNLGRLDESESMTHRVLQDAHARDMGRVRIGALRNLATLSERRRDYPTASFWFEQAWREHLATEQAEGRSAAETLYDWAEVLEAEGKWNDALVRAQEAVELFSVLDDMTPARAVWAAARLLGRLEDPEAGDMFERALQAVKKEEKSELSPQIALDYAQYLFPREPARARSIAEEGLTLAHASDGPASAAQVHALRQWLREHRGR